MEVQQGKDAALLRRPSYAWSMVEEETSTMKIPEMGFPSAAWLNELIKQNPMPQQNVLNELAEAATKICQRQGLSTPEMVVALVDLARRVSDAVYKGRRDEGKI